MTEKKKREPIGDELKGAKRLKGEGFFTYKFRRAKENTITKQYLRGFWVQ